MSIQLATADASIDYAAIKARQQAAWASGDYAVVGTTLQIVGEQLCETLELKAGAGVLDVAAGNGNASLAAARRFTEVTSTDYVESLLDRGKERANAERLPITFAIADAEALPYESGEFDYVLSTFGVMFAPNHEQAAFELLRVTKTGGKVGLANWTPESFVGQVFKTLARYVAPPAGVRSPALWGDRQHLEMLFLGQKIRIEERAFNFRYKSAAHFIDVFRSFYGPVHKAFLSLSEPDQLALERDLIELMQSFNRATNGTMVVPSTYAEVVVEKV